MKTVVNETNQLAKSTPAKSIKSTSLFKQKGASAIEYAVIAAVIVVAIFLAVSNTGLGAAITGVFSDITTALESASTP